MGAPRHGRGPQARRRAFIMTRINMTAPPPSRKPPNRNGHRSTGQLRAGAGSATIAVLVADAMGAAAAVPPSGGDPDGSSGTGGTSSGAGPRSPAFGSTPSPVLGLGSPVGGSSATPSMTYPATKTSDV